MLLFIYCVPCLFSPSKSITLLLLQHLPGVVQWPLGICCLYLTSDGSFAQTLHSSPQSLKWQLWSNDFFFINERHGWWVFGLRKPKSEYLKLILSSHNQVNLPIDYLILSASFFFSFSGQVQTKSSKRELENNGYRWFCWNQFVFVEVLFFS